MSVRELLKYQAKGLFFIQWTNKQKKQFQDKRHHKVVEYALCGSHKSIQMGDGLGIKFLLLHLLHSWEETIVPRLPEASSSVLVLPAVGPK